jgi:hypothetical protein
MSINSLYSRNRGEPLDWVEFFDDFFGDAGDTLLNPWAVDAETGNSTEDFVTDTPNGVYRIATDSTSEGQASRLSFGENLQINLSQKPLVEFRVAVTGSGTNALGSADQRLAVGVCSGLTNGEDTLDSTTTNAWFRIEGANGSWLIESDDGTTDDDDNDTNLDITDGEWTRLAIDFQDLAKVRFYIGGVEVGDLDMSALSANTEVEPVIVMQRDAGTEVEQIDVDYVRFRMERV